MKFAPLACVVVVLLAGSACSRKPAPEPAAGGAAPAAAAPAAAGASVPGPAQSEVETITGEVVETMNASSYTYLRVKAAKGDVWVATAQTKVAVGEKVVVPLETEMQNFRSEALKRDFPLIYFVRGFGAKGRPRRPRRGSPRRPRWRSATGWRARRPRRRHP